jgi:hypothetical protein
MKRNLEARNNLHYRVIDANRHINHITQNRWLYSLLASIIALMSDRLKLFKEYEPSLIEIGSSSSQALLSSLSAR